MRLFKYLYQEYRYRVVKYQMSMLTDGCDRRTRQALINTYLETHRSDVVAIDRVLVEYIKSLP